MIQSQRLTSQRCRGVAAVELAITIVPLLILAFGVSEFGRMMFTFNALDKSVRDATRFMTAPPPTSTNPFADAANIAVFGNVAGTGAPLAPGLTTGMIDICDPAACPGTHNNQPTGSGPIDLVTVSINGYVYTSIVTYVAPTTLAFNNISVTMRR